MHLSIFLFLGKDFKPNISIFPYSLLSPNSIRKTAVAVLEALGSIKNQEGGERPGLLTKNPYLNTHMTISLFGVLF